MTLLGRDEVAPRCDHCDVTCEEAVELGPGWCGECGNCRDHCEDTHDCHRRLAWEEAGDPEQPWPPEPECELCHREGHTIRSCPTRDDHEEGT